LEDGVLNPAKLATSAELDLFIKGLSVEVQEEADLQLVDGMRVALLDAIDIQRARDHGLPDYNTLREAYGLPRVTSFAEITSDVASQDAIAAVYGDVNSIDPFVGALAEDRLPGGSVGPLVAAGYRVQFERLRDGDRFWYENDSDFSASEIAELRQTRLADIILRNTGVRRLQSNVFFAIPEPRSSALLVGMLAATAPSSRRRRAPCNKSCPRSASPIMSEANRSTSTGLASRSIGSIASSPIFPYSCKSRVRE
jgi:hypothetical protein